MFRNFMILLTCDIVNIIYEFRKVFGKLWLAIIFLGVSPVGLQNTNACAQYLNLSILIILKNCT